MGIENIYNLSCSWAKEELSPSPHYWIYCDKIVTTWLLPPANHLCLTPPPPLFRITNSPTVKKLALKPYFISTLQHFQLG